MLVYKYNITYNAKIELQRMMRAHRTTTVKRLNARCTYYYVVCD